MSFLTLRRYTDIPSLIYLLSESKITLFDPQYWDDKNDSSYMNIYKRKRKLKTLLAICFTQSSETYHHWRVFANGPSGVCINFKKRELVNQINNSKYYRNIKMNPIVYKKLQDIRDSHPKLEELPFLKRYAFGHENEFRVIFESNKISRPTLDIPISLTCIRKIVLSPWVHKNQRDHLKNVLNGINSKAKINIVSSNLISNQEWQRQGEFAV